MLLFVLVLVSLGGGAGLLPTLTSAVTVLLIVSGMLGGGAGAPHAWTLGGGAGAPHASLRA